MRELTVILSNFIFILQSFYLLIPLADHSLIWETHNLSLTSVICRKSDCKSLLKMSGHFERPNQNDRYKLGARKTYVWLLLLKFTKRINFSSSESRDLSTACIRLHKIIACRCLRAYYKTNKVLFSSQT